MADEGAVEQVNINIVAHTNGRVQATFSSSVSQLNLTPEEAESLARSFMTAAFMARRALAAPEPLADVFVDGSDRGRKA